MKYTKMHVNGNKILVIEHDEPRKFDIKMLCDPYLGLNCDQIVFMYSLDQDGCEVRFFNKDGSEAQNCGNALLCVGRLLTEQFGQGIFIITGPAGEYQVWKGHDGMNVSFPPTTITEYSSDWLEGKNVIESNIVKTGNFHLCLHVEDDYGPPRDLGNLAQIYFLDGFNVMEYTQRGYALKVRCFERGVGWTEACGSGAIACASVYFKNRPDITETQILMGQGRYIVYKEENGTLVLCGAPQTGIGGDTERGVGGFGSTGV